MSDVPIHLLRDALQSRVPAAPSQECLDAETVAAWADDALGRDERQAAEAHAADCARCQAVLAAMAATMPQATRRSWWRLPAMRWLVPLTVATAGLLVWVNVPRQELAPAPATVLRQGRPEPPQSPADAAANAQPQASFLAEAKPAADARRNKESSAMLDKAEESVAPRSRNENRAAPAKALSESINSPAATPQVTTALPAAPVPAPERSAAESAAPPAAPSVALQRSMAGSAAVMRAPAAMFDARPSTALIVSSNPNSVWRIVANGAVEHSTDRGSTWELQRTGVAVMLSGGASPSPSICWLVGPQGTVLLTTDARSWRRLAFPEAVDLLSVRAADDKMASVTTSDGRTFTTTDGGQTWK